LLRTTALAVVGFTLTAGCTAGGLAEPVGEPAADPAAMAAELQPLTIPSSPLQINFSWSLDEGGSRVSGRGVVRAEAPDRARLDLFGPRGETYLMAALVDGQYRLPPAASANVALPSASLLWSAFGVLEPPTGAELTSATTAAESSELRYRTPQGEVFAYTFDSGAGQPSLSRLERAGGRGIIETVTLERDETGGISRTRYRNWAEYRDLTIDIETVRETNPFPTEIWRPDGTSQ
jgi:hypothetical protein